MKRLLAILLLTVFGLPLASPLLALGRSSEKGLPVCCKRGGQHHCAGNMAMGEEAAAPGSTHLRSPAERCPYAPQALLAGHQPAAAPPVSGAAGFGSLQSHAGALVQAHSSSRMALDRERPKRGPPVSRLS